MTERKASRDPLTSYFLDLAGVQVMSREEEVEAFRRIQSLEAKTVSLLLEASPVPAAEALAAMREDEEVKEVCSGDDGRTESVHRVLEGPLPARLLGPFVQVARLTDAGRAWMTAAMAEFDCGAPDGGPDDPVLVRRPASLLRRVKESAEAARSRKMEFVGSNLKFVVSVAKKYHKHHMSQSLGDLIQEGNIGLMKAVDRYDVDRGYKFSTYAMWWVRHHIQRALTDKEPAIRLPVNTVETVFKVRRATSRHIMRTGEAPSAEQLVEQTGLSLDKVRRAMALRSQPMVSMSAPVNEIDPDYSLADILVDPESESPHESLTKKRLAAEMKRAIRGLNPSESKIIRCRFGMDGKDPMTLQEIGDDMQLSRERIRQVEAIALGKLRKNTSWGRDGI
ncbi:MAG: RNA polymerase sigma factor RpoD [Synergistetes bacterium ADurb.BinA166]|nr:MAG: RNA polymerase sigma factor RpoD [Synergistetes bacterium ADurb.BinA166]